MERIDLIDTNDVEVSNKHLLKAKKMDIGKVPLKVSETITIYVKPKNKNRKYADKWLKRYQDNLYGRTCKSGFED
jgi:tRNA A37 threonylcarbamoyladenosine dehydratase